MCSSDLEKSKLEKHEVFDLENEKIQLEQNLQTKKDGLAGKEKNLDKQKNNELGLNRKKDEEEQKLARLDAEITEKIEDLDYDSDEAQFFNHSLARKEFMQKYKNGEFVFDLWKKETENYRNKLAAILKAIEKLDKARVDFQDADKELAEARKKTDLNEVEAKKWGELFAEEREILLSAIYSWIEQATELKLAEFDIQEMSRVCGNLFESCSADDLKSIVDRNYLTNFKRLEQEIASLQQKCTDNKQLCTAKKEEIKEWQSKKDPEPSRHKETILTRQELDSKSEIGRASCRERV